MLFAVKRTSCSDGTKPCDEAIQMPYTRIDVRSADDPCTIPAFKAKDPFWWYGSGSNHRVVNGQIMRDFPDEEWFVEIESLESMMAFHEKYGEIVIGRHADNYTILAIEIYDSYRE